MSTGKLIRRKAASEYLHEAHGLDRAPSTLAKLAVIGGGPVFRRIGRVPLYATDDLDKWVASKLSAPMRSTSDTASPNVAKTCSTQGPLAAGNITSAPRETRGGEQQNSDTGAGERHLFSNAGA